MSFQYSTVENEVKHIFLDGKKIMFTLEQVILPILVPII